MAFFDNIRNAIHPYDDEYMENEESAAEEEFEQERAPEEESYEPPRPALFPPREQGRTHSAAPRSGKAEDQAPACQAFKL